MPRPRGVTKPISILEKQELDGEEENAVVRRKPVKTKTGVEVTSCYCRKCMRNRNPNRFLKATDPLLDSNGLMSVCKDCIADMWMNFYSTSEQDIYKAMLRLCRILNVQYSVDALDAVKKQYDSKAIAYKEESFFGLYRTKLLVTQKVEKMQRNPDADFTFHEPNIVIRDTGDLDEVDGKEDLEAFWGEGLGFGDYEFLEKELAEWKQSYSCSNKAEEFILKEICHKQLELRNKRVEGQSVDNILKSATDLLKNGGLTPAQANAASQGKNVDSWGMIIKEIEQTTPAEYYKDKKLFADVDKIDKYVKNFILRSIKNFILGSKDFNISEEDSSDEYEEFKFEEVDDADESKSISG